MNEASNPEIKNECAPYGTFSTPFVMPEDGQRCAKQHYADISITKAKNGFILSFGYGEKKVARTFDEMIEIVKEIFGLGAK